MNMQINEDREKSHCIFVKLQLPTFILVAILYVVFKQKMVINSKTKSIKLMRNLIQRLNLEKLE